MMGQRKLYFCG